MRNVLIVTAINGEPVPDHPLQRILDLPTPETLKDESVRFVHSALMIDGEV